MSTAEVFFTFTEYAMLPPGADIGFASFVTSMELGELVIVTVASSESETGLPSSS